MGFPTLRQFKQCRPIPVAMLKKVHLAMVQTSQNGRVPKSNDFSDFQTV